MYKLDHYKPKRIALMKAKGSVVGTKLRPFLGKLSQVCFLVDIFAGRLTYCLSQTHTHTLPHAYAYAWRPSCSPLLSGENKLG